MSNQRQRAAEAPELIPHGTIGGYTNWGCKCDACLEKWAAYIESYRLRRWGHTRRVIRKGCNDTASAEVAEVRSPGLDH